MSDWKDNRPPDWEELWHKYNIMNCRVDFEVGADAILEALKSSGIRMENYHPSNRTVIETAAFLNQCEDGILVFIPEESK